VGSGQIRADYEVSAKGQSFDAFQVATGTLAAWDAFLAAHGLRP
jgi:hypothetical protein